MPKENNARQAGGLIEQRSIDHIPDSERHGRPRNLFSLWFAANLQISAVVTGSLAVVFGLDASWSLVALLLGNLLGGAVMALHAAQGPRLGLPQMISSRAQFGVRGAAIPLVCSIVMYIGFFASGSVLAGQAVGHLTHTGETTGIVVFALATAVTAAVGYRLIHRVGKVATAVGVVAFLYLGVRMAHEAPLGTILGEHHFSAPLFLLAMSLSASWQLGFGPYVADSSRYLPRETPPRSVFWATMGGSVLGAQWSMGFGALAAAWHGGREGDEVGRVIGMGGSAAVLTWLLYFAVAFGKLTVNVLNTYGGFMSLITGISGFRPLGPVGPRARSLYVGGIMLTGTALALLGRGHFLESFSTFLLFLLIFFTPWSAINLVDFYLLSKERYDIAALADPHGRYGAWNMRALTTYAAGILVQLPFLSSELYTGPLVSRLGGADISWIVGLVLPALLYWLLARRDRDAVPGGADGALEPEVRPFPVRSR
ncbi:purine-cytosine permease family protein [Streptomyces rubradiris]|uniref:Cytosine permease n=1 Tax=Streptomyces rubradiris TaxID=285531 RepID=A0ABQ3RQS4_STRRR|nr:cytosine permease [Streptomyces rubradiris]GHH30471.1 cytosine permease [Streptomyces rubradiris]GHI52907.1 cytosine permease [Streptomyces rubradiris]GHI58188.1 cytosine permease [Streptomyces rubradiris]